MANNNRKNIYVRNEDLEKWSRLLKRTGDKSLVRYILDLERQFERINTMQRELIDQLDFYKIMCKKFVLKRDLNENEVKVIKSWLN
jgi:hypothetical protein